MESAPSLVINFHCTIMYQAMPWGKNKKKSNFFEGAHMSCMLSCIFPQYHLLFLISYHQLTPIPVSFLCVATLDTVYLTGNGSVIPSPLLNHNQ